MPLPRLADGSIAGGPGRPPGRLNNASLDIKEACANLCEDPEYRESLRRRLIAGTAPHMEALVHHYAYGKPKERVEVDARMTGHTTIVHRQLVEEVALAKLEQAKVVEAEAITEVAKPQLIENKADS